MLIVFCVALVFTFGQCRDDQNFLTKTVHVGEDVTLTCSRQNIDVGTLFWIRLVAGNLPEVLGATYTFASAYFNKTPRITAKQEPGTFVLHITKTELSDTAFYYCEKHVELRTTFLNITFLRVKGKWSNIPYINYTVVQRPTVSDRVYPGDSVTLQCSVISHSEKHSCPGDHSVHWFGVSPDQSFPNIIYAYGNGPDECGKKPDARSPTKSCVYHFSKNVSSSDAGTYYCAVATCGEILFGNGTKVEIEGNCIILFSYPTLLPSYAVLILTHQPKSYNAFWYLSFHIICNPFPQRDEDKWIYSAVVFTMMKTGSGGTRDAKTKGRERTYAAVKAFGLD
uniref:Ig-like domain-containing protein n=1 Tax=Seriola dumerili TaxID=41447 RepID=A0A3B4TCU7_SERDU